MKAYLNRLAEEYEKGELELTEEALKKLSGGELRAGAKCAWCYEEDVDFWKHEREPMPHPMRWPYSGILMPFPDVCDGRGTIELEHVCVCILDYPIEKENPATDWAPLSRVLTSPRLHRFHVMATIKPALMI